MDLRNGLRAQTHAKATETGIVSAPDFLGKAGMNPLYKAQSPSHSGKLSDWTCSLLSSIFKPVEWLHPIPAEGSEASFEVFKETEDKVRSSEGRGRCKPLMELVATFRMTRCDTSHSVCVRLPLVADSYELHLRSRIFFGRICFHDETGLADTLLCFV